MISSINPILIIFKAARDTKRDGKSCNNFFNLPILLFFILIAFLVWVYTPSDEKLISEVSREIIDQNNILLDSLIYDTKIQGDLLSTSGGKLVYFKTVEGHYKKNFGANEFKLFLIKRNKIFNSSKGNTDSLNSNKQFNWKQLILNQHLTVHRKYFLIKEISFIDTSKGINWIIASAHATKITYYKSVRFILANY